MIYQDCRLRITVSSSELGGAGCARGGRANDNTSRPSFYFLDSYSRVQYTNRNPAAAVVVALGGLEVKEVFMLRKSPTRTEAFLAANRRNAQKCTGPRTPEGKARVSLNALKHGAYAQRLPEKLEAAGYKSAAALYGRIRSEITTTFKVENGAGMKPVERATAMVWSMARRAGVLGNKPQSPIFSSASSPLAFPLPPTRFRIKDHWKRIGMVYWVQRRRYWTGQRFWKDLASGQPAPIPTVGEVMEEKLRKRVFRLGRPGFIERIEYGLDGRGVVDPNATPPDPVLVRLHKKLFAGRWWEGKR